jgi:hypothetical protein
MANDPQKNVPLDDLAILASIVVAMLFILVELGANVATLFVH